MTIKKRLYANNAKTTLALDITPSDTVIQVTDGSLFPTPGLGEYFLATLEFGSSIEIVKVTGRSGNSFVGCIRGQEGTPASSFQAGIKVGNRVTRDTLNDFERGVGLMDRVDSVDLLDTPPKSSNNAYICNSKDSSGNSSVAIKNSDTAWRFLTHSTISVAGSASSGTLTSVSSTAIGNKLISIVPGKYLVQFMTGNNRGLVRAVTSVSTNTLGWFTPLPEVSVVGDQFEVYMSDSSTLGDGTGIIPISSGGTGAITAPVALITLGAIAKAGDTLNGAINLAPPISLAVASASFVGTSNSNNITITGSGTITNFGPLVNGGTKNVVFTGICTLTHNPSSFILPTSANIITAAGDTATFLSMGGDNWKCITYQKFNGQPLVGVNSTDYVQQGGGIGQGVNKVYIGLGTNGGLKSTVDSTDMGFFTFSSTKDQLSTWQNISTTGSIYSQLGFTGPGTGLTSVTAINTSSISNATDKQYGWTGVQKFYSASQAGVGTPGPPNTALRVSDNSSGTSAAAMTFVRENLFGINLGINTNNSFVIGGYSVNGTILTLTQTGDLTVLGSISGTSISGNGSNLTGFTSNQITTALAFTPVQQGGGIGQLNNKIKIGYVEVAGVAGVKITVDSSDMNYVAFSRLANAFSTDKQIITDASVTAAYYIGNGGGLTNVTSVNTSSITGSLSNAYTWLGVQTFPSTGQTGIVEGSNSSTHSKLIVSSTSAEAATMTFIRQGAYAVNVGLDTNNSWSVGGYSATAVLMSVSSTGKFSAKDSITAGAGFLGNISACTGLSSSQVTTALGYTPVQQSGGPGQGPNKVYLGWGTNGGLKVGIDTSDQGYVALSGTNPTNGMLNFNAKVTSLGFVGDGAGLSSVSAADTASVAGAAGKVNVWQNTNTFVSYRNIPAPGDSGGLIVAATPNVGAIMTFIRPGLMAVNFGLDVDNVFKLGGYSVSPSSLMTIDMGGNFTALGNITAYSDRRIKKDIEPIKNALSTLMKLQGVTYTRKSNDQPGRGFIAQEIEAVYPELVQTEVSGEHYKSVAYGNLAGDFVEALRELNDRLLRIEEVLNIKGS